MQMGNNGFKPVKLLIIVFIMLSCFFLLGRDLLFKASINQTVVIIGNLLLFLISILTLTRAIKAINNPNPHVFVRVFYGGFIIRLFACAAAAFVYIYLNDGKVSKPSLFACLGIYVLYSVIETSALKRMLKEKSNA